MIQFDRKFSIGPFEISQESPTFIIAEAGVNHGGDIALAKHLIDIAAGAGVDAVKFQAFRTENLILSNVEKAPYQKNTTAASESQFDMLKKLELKKEAYLELKDYCTAKGLIFLITPFDEQSLDELEEVGVDAYKIASTDTTNLLFLRKVAQTGKPVILSTGMCDLNEVTLALEEINPINKKLVLLQCTANYPIQDDEANLNVIHTFKKTYDVVVGYSDHSVGLGAALYSIPMGAKVVEKHFTLNKELDGPDHLASLDPEELKEFVLKVKQIERYMGGFVKEPTASEFHTKKSLQKSLVAASQIKKGEIIEEKHLIAKRTGGAGISPIHYSKIVGQAATKDYQKDDIIYV